MIEIKDVYKSFGRQEILKGVNLVVSGETVGLLGANGAGKSTLLKCILGILEFDGMIRVAGFDVRKDPIEAKRRISYIPQSFPLWPDLSVEEALRFCAKLREAPRSREDQLLEEFGLAAHSKKTIATLSGGMRQKLSIAIALLSDPEVILLDEPTASLDAWATREILRILSGWHGKKSILLSSHRTDEIEAVADRCVFIRDGILAERSGFELKEDTCVL